MPGGSEWLVYWNDTYVKTYPLVGVYVKVTGFWQYWDMFAPNPAHTDSWGDALVVYKDGTTKHHSYPRMFVLPLWQKFLSERYRKFFERAGNDDYPYLWPSFALRIALMNDNPKNPPVTVKLFRHFRQVAGPDKLQAQDYSVENYFNYQVDQKELKRLRGLPL